MNDRPEPFSHPVPIEELAEDARSFSFDADSEERAELAERYDVPEIRSLKADMSVRKFASLIRVEGTLKSELVRTCVVSLEPMEETIDETFAEEFTLEASEVEEPEGEIEADLNAPEPISGDTLDLGAVALEQLVLAMSPHPRKEGAKAPEDPGAGKETSPFDVLKELKT